MKNDVQPAPLYTIKQVIQRLYPTTLLDQHATFYSHIPFYTMVQANHNVNAHNVYTHNVYTHNVYPQNMYAQHKIMQFTYMQSHMSVYVYSQNVQQLITKHMCLCNAAIQSIVCTNKKIPLTVYTDSISANNPVWALETSS